MPESRDFDFFLSLFILTHERGNEGPPYFHLHQFWIPAFAGMTTICKGRKWFRRGGPVCPPGFLNFPAGHPPSRKIAFSFCRGGSRTALQFGPLRHQTRFPAMSINTTLSRAEGRRTRIFARAVTRYLPGCVRSPQTANASFLTLSSRRRRRIEGRWESNASRRARGHPSIRGFAATQDEAEGGLFQQPICDPYKMYARNTPDEMFEGMYGHAGPPLRTQ